MNGVEIFPETWGVAEVLHEAVDVGELDYGLEVQVADDPQHHTLGQSGEHISAPGNDPVHLKNKKRKKKKKIYKSNDDNESGGVKRLVSNLVCKLQQSPICPILSS